MRGQSEVREDLVTHQGSPHFKEEAAWTYLVHRFSCGLASVRAAGRVYNTGSVLHPQHSGYVPDGTMAARSRGRLGIGLSQAELSAVASGIESVHVQMQTKRRGGVGGGRGGGRRRRRWRRQRGKGKGECARVARKPILIPPWFRAVLLPSFRTMVRAPTICRSQAILRRMDTAPLPILREDRRDAPSPLSGAPTAERHDEPRAAEVSGNRCARMYRGRMNVPTRRGVIPRWFRGACSLRKVGAR